MKKWLAILLAAVLVLSLAGCAKEEAPATMDLTETSDTTTETSETTDTTEATEVAAEETTTETDTTAEVSKVTQLAKDYFTNMPEHIYKISQKDVVDMVAAGTEALIIDIRAAKDYEAGHLKGAVNLPWGTAISDALTSIPNDQEVFLYCYTGQTAGQTVAVLNMAGINVRSVNLGWNLGISKVEGVDAVTETTVNTLPEATYEVDPEVAAAITDYFTGLSTVADSVYKNYKISEDNLKGMMDDGSDIVVLSIRKAADFETAHIAGAINIPFGTTFADDLSALPTDKTIVVYCYSGQTAGQATAALRMMGYDAVSLNGGFGVGANAPSGWTNKGFQTVSMSALYESVMNYFTNKPDHSYLMDQTEMVAKVAAGDAMTIIDIRSAADYEAGHLKGAVNLPWGPAISEGLTMIPQDQEVYIYCYSGQTAGQAVATLNIAGINARSVKYGWNFGLSKVEGIADVTETTVNTLPEATYEVEAGILEAITAYYAGLADVSESTFKNYKVSEDDLAAMIEAGDDFILVSARKADDYAAGHIQGAINAPYGTGFAESFMAQVNKTKPTVLYCYSGQTAGQATAAMRLLGYNVMSLNGGVGTAGNAPLGWSNKGYELVTQ